jgi:5-(carboxyamino)imidazole ribonucleotide synthase
VASFPTIGILGGGQLGKMMAAEAVRMSVNVRLLSPKDAGPMQAYAGARAGDWTDPDVLRDFGADCDVLTVESEWAPAAEAADALPASVDVRPSPDTLSLIKDKGVQKRHLADADCPVPAVDATAHSPAEVRATWPDLAADDGLMVETFANFTRELAVQVARRPGGEQVVYPVAYTEQKDHRCHAVEVPADVGDEIAEKARTIARRSVDAVDGVGLVAVELFEMPDGQVLVNELAPRPHNTGHYSIEGCHTSQFENHVRAILDWPLGSTALRALHAVMVNVLGGREGTPARADTLPDALAVDGVTPHIYGKPDVRPGRKMGHVTALGADPQDTRARAERAADAIDL